MNIFEKIVQFNEERGLIEKGFNHTKETSFIIEELLESTGAYDSISAREEAERYASEMTGGHISDDETRVDAFADIVVYALGAITKLGYNPEKVMAEVVREISSRTGKLVDGKFVKDLDAETYTADFSVCKR